MSKTHTAGLRSRRSILATESGVCRIEQRPRWESGPLLFVTTEVRRMHTIFGAFLLSEYDPSRASDQEDG